VHQILNAKFSAVYASHARVRVVGSCQSAGCGGIAGISLTILSIRVMAGTEGEESD
jgi:hypothetical protein